MSKATVLATFAALSLVLVACGDDTTSPLPSGTAGGGQGGEGGRGGGGGAGGGDGGQGGEGGAPALLADGSHCLASEECASGFCLTEQDTGWPQGYCTGACNSLISCDEGSECLYAGNDPFCFKSCDPAAPTCEVAQLCLELDARTAVCVAGCTLTAHCPTLGKCDILSGYCVEPEDCADSADNDGDSYQDCEDPDCTQECATDVSQACTGLATAQASNAGDTIGGSAYFAGSCTGSLGATERVYSFTPALSGFLRVALDSPTDQGVYVRTDCVDGASELACVDDQLGGATEVLLTPVTSGVPVTIFVDGYAPTEAGPFTMDVSVLVPVGESEPNDTVGEANDVGAALVTATINPAGDADYFAVTVANGGATITVSTAGDGADVCGPTGTVDTEVAILDVDGTTVLAQNDDLGFTSYCSVASASGLAAGTYYVRAAASASFCAGCTFAYALAIDVQ